MTTRAGRRAVLLFAAFTSATTVVRADPAAAPAAPPPQAPPRNIAGPGDYGLRERLVGLLGRDADLGHQKIFVVMVNGGAVFSGEVSSCALEMRALRLAAAIRGVINVTDEMHVARSTLPDPALQKAVESGLKDSAQALGLKDLVVRVQDGAATLEGTVTDFDARVRAEEIAGSVAGVTRVSNHLLPADVPEGKDDASLVKAVVDYLGDLRRFAHPGEIQVRAQGGAVTLTGRVALYMGRQQAAVLASLVRGVARVDNRIKVDPSIPTLRGMRSARPVITGRT